MIINNYQGRTEEYPTIQRVQIGNPDSNALRKIDQTTHQLLLDHGEKYEATIGHANRGRFASPLYTSVIIPADGKIRPIITTLKTVPDRNRHLVDGLIQDEYKKTIL